VNALRWWPWRRRNAARDTVGSWAYFDAWPWRGALFAVLDLETSGLDARRHHIVQIGAVRLEREGIALGNLWSGLVQGQGERSAESLLIHEISPQQQAAGQDLAQVMRDFAQYARGTLLTAWDADFDLSFLEPAWRAAGLDGPMPVCLDLAEMAACLLPEWQGRRHGLDDCLAYCGLPAIERHDALGDALASAQLLQLLMSRAERKGLRTVGQLRKAMQHHGRRLAAVF